MTGHHDHRPACAYALPCALLLALGAVEGIAAPSAPPTPARCIVGIYLVSLSDVNLRSGTCVADFWVWFRWTDAVFNPVESIEVIDGTIDEKTGELRKTLKDGAEYACYRIRATIRQKWNVSRFPLDTQRITISLEDSVSEADEILLVPDEAGTRVSPAISVPGWSLGGFAIDSRTQAYETNYGDTDLPSGANSEYSRVVATVELQRPGMGLFFKLFTGLFVAVGIALVSMAIRPTDLDPRFGLPVGAMFASIASQYVIASVLPDSADFTLADQLHVIAVSVIFLVILESVVSLLLTYSRLARLSRRLDAACLVLLLAATVAVVVWVVNAGDSHEPTSPRQVGRLPRPLLDGTSERAETVCRVTAPRHVAVAGRPRAGARQRRERAAPAASVSRSACHLVDSDGVGG